MRTTIRLPDDLYERVRHAAREEGLTVTRYIERSLQNALTAGTGERLPPYRVDAFHGDGLRPGVDLDDNSALLDLMDTDDRA
jgi:hypothetical protein